MSLVQLIECTNCGKSESIPYNPSNLRMPWEVWKNGCPDCGCVKVDVIVVLDKSGQIQDIKKGWSGATALVHQNEGSGSLNGRGAKDGGAKSPLRPPNKEGQRHKK